MQNVNYIVQLNIVLRRFEFDATIKPTHISLYMSFFKLWNEQRFPGILKVYRSEVMDLAKILSKTTYHKRLRELGKKGYLIYYPSNDPSRGSKIQMVIYENTIDQKMNKSEPRAYQKMDGTVPREYQKLVSNNKQVNNKTKNQMERPKNELVVLEFFKEKKWPLNQAGKFYFYFESIGWKMGGKIPIENWHVCANSWILKVENDRPEKMKLSWDNLKTSKDKDYGKPL